MFAKKPHVFPRFMIIFLQICITSFGTSNLPRCFVFYDVDALSHVGIEILINEYHLLRSSFRSLQLRGGKPQKHHIPRFKNQVKSRCENPILKISAPEGIKKQVDHSSSHSPGPIIVALVPITKSANVLTAQNRLLEACNVQNPASCMESGVLQIPHSGGFVSTSQHCTIQLPPNCCYGKSVKVTFIALPHPGPNEVLDTGKVGRRTL